MARALGIDATMAAAFEGSYGTPPVSGFRKLPFTSADLGEEQGLIEDDSLGQGREGEQDPTYDLINNTGDVVTGIFTDSIGMWLKGLLGAPATSGTTNKTHVFTSGAASLPSMAIEIGHPKVPSFRMNYGCAVNQMRFSLSRGGLSAATLSLIAQGETKDTTTQAGTPTLLSGDRFANALGYVKKDGVQLGQVTSASLAISNGMEAVETIRADGRIDGVDPVMFAANGSLTVRYADNVLDDLPDTQAPLGLELGFTKGAASLKFVMQRVFLPKVKKRVSGPGGLMVEYNFSASGKNGATLVATLVNTVASY